MRNCRKCNEVIPNRLRIDGKQHVLGNRKFCLKCSPFKAGNRNSVEPFKNKRSKLPYKDWAEGCKQISRKSIYKRGIRRKAQLIITKGRMLRDMRI